MRWASPAFEVTLLARAPPVPELRRCPPPGQSAKIPPVGLDTQAGHRSIEISGAMTDFAMLAVTTTENGHNSAENGHNSADPVGIVTVSGEIDLASAPRLRQALVEVLHPNSDAIVDLSGVAFVDASGIGVLVGAAHRACSMGGRLILRHPSRPVTRLLDLLDLDGALAVES